MKQITISDETWGRLVRAAQLTEQDPERWADAILARTAEGVLRVMEKQEAAARGARWNN